MNALLAVLLLFQTQTATGPLSMAASTEKKILVVRIGGTDVKTYDVAVGSKAHATPTGQFTVKHLVWNPAASHGCIRMAEADAVELARYLMEQTGAHHTDDWYSNVVASTKPTDVRLPVGIPMVIGK